MEYLRERDPAPAFAPAFTLSEVEYLNPKFEQGAALVVVMWLIVLLSAVVISFVMRITMEAGIVHNITATAEAAAAAKSVYQIITDHMLQDANDYDLPDEAWADTSSEEWIGQMQELFPGRKVSAVVWDEGSRINLNTASIGMLRRLFKEDKRAVDSILDWRDADQDTREFGAEQSFYVQQNPPLKCRDGLLGHKSELKLVRAVGDYYEQIKDQVTTYGMANPNILSPDVFESLCCSISIDDFVAERLARELKDLQGKNIRLKSYDDLLQMPSMHRKHLEMLEGLFVFGGIYNINFMTADQMAYVLPDCGIAAEDVKLTFGSTKKFRTFDDLIAAMIAAGMDEKSQDYARQLVTVSSSVFGINVSVQCGENSRYNIDAIVRRFREKPDDHQWVLEVLYWKEGLLSSQLEGGEGPSESAEAK